MARPKSRRKIRHIAVAVEMDQPYPHHLGCYRGIMRYAATKGDWQTTLDPFLVGISEHAGVREYDGIVGRIPGKAGEAARTAGIPVVNHWINAPGRGLPSVLPDCRKGARMAAEHLMARGFRRFGFVGSARDRGRTLYLSGFEPPLRERGFEVDTFDAPLQIEANTKTFARFYRDLKAWLATLTPPVALLVPMEVHGLYIIQICGELGLRLPHEVGMVVCRENLTIGLQTTPTLTCIEDDNEQIGYRAAELLDRIVLGSTKEPAEPVWVEPKALLVRGSSDAFVSEDPMVSRAMRFITENSHRALRLEDVALASGASKRTLQQRFARHAGRSIYSEIHRLKIERVKRLLLDSDDSLAKIADDNEFTDVSHLVKSFRKATGVTPGSFRKTHRPLC